MRDGKLESGRAAALGAVLQNLIEQGSRYGQVLSALGAWCAQQAQESEAGARMLRSVVDHALFLLAEGNALYEHAEIRVLPGRQRVLRLQRVARVDGVLVQVTVRAANADLSQPKNVFHGYFGSPNIYIARQVVTELGQVLSEDEKDQFYRARQCLADDIERARTPAPAWQQSRAANRDAIIDAYRAAHAGPPPPPSAPRPCSGAILHILPRLVVPPAGCSILAHLTAIVPHIAAMGYATLMLGVVDPQSCSAYIGEDESGNLSVYPNNHGYWSSGATGTDPVLGSAAEYRELVARVRASGMDFIQDAIFATLGYPAQLGRFVSSTLAAPASCLMLGTSEVPLSDSRLFLHEPDGCMSDLPPEEYDEQHYADVLDQYHHAPLFALPRPNLHEQQVLDAVLLRALAQCEAGVTGFRVDMAKHIPIGPLRHIIRTLRAAAPAPPPRFRLLLEYWSLRYGDLAVAWEALGSDRDGVLFYDFPLADTLHRMLVRDADYTGSIAALLAERTRWKLPLSALSPTFIDHDFHFRPIYNGSAHSCARVVAGYALAMLLSDNPLYVYFGFDQAAAGVPNAAHFDAFDEFHSRQPVREVLDLNNKQSPAQPLHTLLALFRSGFASAPTVLPGSTDTVSITRLAWIDGATRRVQADVTRTAGGPAPSDAIFCFGTGPVISLRYIET